jgi:hypothetical protein
MPIQPIPIRDFRPPDARRRGNWPRPPALPPHLPRHRPVKPAMPVYWPAVCAAGAGALVLIGVVVLCAALLPSSRDRGRVAGAAQPVFAWQDQKPAPEAAPAGGDAVPEVGAGAPVEDVVLVRPGEGPRANLGPAAAAEPVAERAEERVVLQDAGPVFGKRPATECLGTAVDFVDNPQEASKIAARENKLLFVLHVSGNFEDPQFT